MSTRARVCAGRSTGICLTELHSASAVSVRSSFSQPPLGRSLLARLAWPSWPCSPPSARWASSSRATLASCRPWCRAGPRPSHPARTAPAAATRQQRGRRRLLLLTCTAWAGRSWPASWPAASSPRSCWAFSTGAHRTHRLCVAFTRARHHLILAGAVRDLAGMPAFRDVVAEARKVEGGVMRAG